MKNKYCFGEFVSNGLAFIVTKVLFPFVMAAYAENEEAKGLWRFTLPFKAIFSHFKAILLLWVKLLPLFILLFSSVRRDDARVGRSIFRVERG